MTSSVMICNSKLPFTYKYKVCGGGIPGASASTWQGYVDHIASLPLNPTSAFNSKLPQLSGNTAVGASSWVGGYWGCRNGGERPGSSRFWLATHAQFNLSAEEATPSATPSPSILLRQELGRSGESLMSDEVRTLTVLGAGSRLRCGRALLPFQELTRASVTSCT
ncbi:hypothetical protein Hamer_G032096, partial [Homarus americanus]